MKHTPGRLYIRTNRHPNTDGTPWGWVDLYEPGSMRQASPEGIQATWSRGQQSEANARRLVACWNACEGIDTEYLEGNDSLPHYARRLMAQRDELLQALKQMLDAFYHDPLGGGQDAAIEAALDAVAKAEGEK